MSDMPFIAATEQYRGELLRHCYRMLGALDDAEDLVQETYLRAWRAWDDFQGQSSVRVWLHRIATNACLSALQGRPRRVLPTGLGTPSDDPSTLAPEADDVLWLQPLPDPADVATANAGLRLALIACLQYLPPRQRAVLIFRDVLGWPAREVAEALDMSVPAARSALQRAREQLSKVAPHQDDIVEPTEAEAKSLLDGYIAAFERADLGALERILRADATLEAARSRTWFAGKRACLEYIRGYLDRPGDWRLTPTTANGQPAAAAYWHGQAFALVVLTVATDGIAAMTLFTDTGLFARFGLPTRAPSRSRVLDGRPT
jgi:RNA polymerase sigma-70 factor (ECF subfamily)